MSQPTPDPSVGDILRQAAAAAMNHRHSAFRKAQAPIIARIISEVGIDDWPALRQALRNACPCMPWDDTYNAYCEETRYQLSLVGFSLPAHTAKEES